MTFGTDGYALAEGEGEGLWFFNGLFTVKAGGPQTRDAFTLIEAHLPNDMQVPPHIHEREDEGFYVLEGGSPSSAARTLGPQAPDRSPCCRAVSRTRSP